MSDAPEKIWAAPDTQSGWAEANAGDWPSPLNKGDTPYIREDVAQAMAAKAREDALREAAAIVPQTIKTYGMMKPGKPDQYASREAQIVAKGFARLIEEEILALIDGDKP